MNFSFAVAMILPLCFESAPEATVTCISEASLLQLTCEMQVKNVIVENMPKRKPSPKRRSGCPLNASVETLGDRWSLLILRDMMLRGFRTYKEFLGSYEGIATNILADRLRKLVVHGIITTEPDPSDGRKLIYSLTAKGIDLAPVLTEMVLWAAAHEKTGNQALVRQMRKGKEQFLAAIRQRWAERLVPANESSRNRHVERTAAPRTQLPARG